MHVVHLLAQMWDQIRVGWELERGPYNDRNVSYQQYGSAKQVNKQTEIKCNPDIEVSVNVMTLTTYQLVKPSEFNEQSKPIGWYGQNRSILICYNGNPNQQYGISIICSKWNNKFWKIVFHTVEAQRPILLGFNTLKNQNIHKAPQSHNRAN